MWHDGTRGRRPAAGAAPRAACLRKMFTTRRLRRCSCPSPNSPRWLSTWFTVVRPDVRVPSFHFGERDVAVMSDDPEGLDLQVFAVFGRVPRPVQDDVQRLDDKAFEARPLAWPTRFRNLSSSAARTRSPCS